jgi:hypothetical protein
MLLSIGPALAAGPVDLITNGGFEQGMTGWNPDPKHTLVTGAAEAHSGTACLSGEATGPNQALFLRQRVPVKRGNRYEIDFWAKGGPGTKVVVFAVQPGTTVRKSVAPFDKLTRRWQRCTTPVTVESDGTLELQLIVPSSHGATPGQVWIDDVAFYEREMPPVTSVTKGEAFNDEPAMAAAEDGSLYLAWVSFRDGADSLQVARLQPQGDTLKPLGTWQVVAGKGTYVLGPRAVASSLGAVVTYAAENDGNWDIYAVTCTPDGPGKPVALTSDAGVDVKPSAAWQQGTLWFVWESNRNGWREIFVASHRDGRTSEPVSLSPADTSCYGPAIAVLDSGRVCVAWHAFVANNYDVYLRRQAADGVWLPQAQLTRAPTIDRHPLLLAKGDELWLIYENAQTEEYNIGRTNRRRLLAAKVGPEGLLAPVTTGSEPLAGRCEAPGAAFDAAGRLWISYRAPRLPRSGWDVFLTCLDSGRWQAPTTLSMSKGMDRASPLVLAGDRAMVAFQADDLPQSWNDVDLTLDAKSEICVAAVKTGEAPRGSALELAPLAEPDEPFEPAELRVLRGEDLPTQSIQYEGRTLKLFFGDLHEHTDVSVCNRLGDQSVDESYQHMRDLGRHQFACATDHGYNINPYLWSYLGKLARVNDDPGRFLTFLGEEWTSTFEEYDAKHPYGFYGHRNLILADPYFPRWWNARSRQTPAEVWEDLRKMNANFIHIPHQLADTGNVPTNWDFNNETAQPVAEIFQTRGSYEYKGTVREAARSTPGPGYFLQDAWARGIVIGVIASPDHGGGYGKACVYAPDLTREAILDAIRARRCYGTTAAKIVLDVRVDGRLMGEKLTQPAGRSVEVTIHARCPGDIDRIEVCRNNRFIYTTRPSGTSADLSFVDREPLEGRSYYYVRLVQADEEIAWSSPVWFGAE